MQTMSPHLSDSGDIAVDPSLSIMYLNGGVVIRPREARVAPLVDESMTKREREVLSLVAEGQSNKLIGNQLSICERTVKSHLTSIMTKPESTEEGRRVSVLKRQEGAPVLLG